MTQASTRNRILDVAEKLIAENGIGRTSLRSIVSKAKVNIAAVNYHFGSKQALILTVFQRHLGPVNAERISRLDELQESAEHRPIKLEDILEAFLRPALSLGFQHPRRKQLIMRLFGRIHAEPLELQKMVMGQFEEVFRRYFEALQHALPELPPYLLAARMHFMIGAMISVMMTPPHFVEAQIAQNESDLESTLTNLIQFLSAGFRSEIAIPGANHEG